MVILAAFMTTVNAATPLPTKWPDPLVASNGMAVTNKKLWRTTRRPELKTMFEHYMYGTLPPAPLKVVSTLRREDKKFFGGKATLKEVTIALGGKDAPRLNLLLVRQVLAVNVLDQCKAKGCLVGRFALYGC